MTDSWSTDPALGGSGLPLTRYDFPEDPRQLGGAFTVDENADRLLRFFCFERLASRAHAGWLMGTPEFEVKVEYGRHIFYHAEAAKRMRDRLTELRTSPDTTDSYRNDEIELFFDELMTSESPAHFVCGIYGVLLPYMEHAYRRHLDLTDQVADAPTIRAIGLILFDYNEMRRWGIAAMNAYIKGGYDAADITEWQLHLEQLLRSIGGITGTSEREPTPAELRSKSSGEFKRSFIATRDPRFKTFDQTYEYKVADEGKVTYETEFDETKLNLIRTQRDELDAIETFSNVLYEIRDVPFEFDYDMARIIWDECRHTEMGHKAIAGLGHYPFDLANRLLGIKVRTPMPPEYSLAEINLFGEANIVQECLRFSRDAYARGDRIPGMVFDYVHADERTHLAKGAKWLRYIFKTDSLQDIVARTREIAVKRLLELGIIDHEVALTISHKELSRIIGE
jgi:hypothetical protein